LKQVEKMIKIVENRSMSWNNFREICEWLGFGLGVTSEASTLAPDVQEKLYRLFDLGSWLLTPADYLGQALCESNHGKRSGFYPTPMHVCTMMAKMTFPEGKDSRAKTTMDCCVGTGRLLLAASNYSLRLFGQDIDPLVCLISKINFALYAPWHHIPESFYGDPTPLDPDKEASKAEKMPPGGWNEQGSGNKRTTRQPSKDKKPVYTTGIEQLDLFGFGD